MFMFRVILPVMALALALPTRADEVAATVQTPKPATPVVTGTGAKPATVTPPPTAKPLPPRPSQRRQSFNDLVRGLVAAHEVQPLKSVLEVARKASAGEVVSIKLRRQKARWVYHVRLLKQDGRRAELEIDGKSLKMLERK